MTANRWPGLPDATASQIEEALARGQKIEAIKLYRDATNCGLKEAKDAIEQGGPVTISKDWRKDAEENKRPSSAWLTWTLALVLIGLILVVIAIVMR